MNNRSNIFWGLALLLVGIVLTAWNFNILPFEGPNVVAGMFLLIGLLFFTGYLTAGITQWGWLFPASILSGVGGGIWLEELTNNGEFTGALIVFSVCIPFWVAYLTQQRSNWWAIIPAGVILSVSAMIAGIGLNTNLRDEVFVGGMLAGIGLVFLYIYQTKPRNWWAIIPAGSLFAVANVVFLEGLNLPNFWETRLLAGGLFLILAATFGFLWLKREDHGTAWARFPAIILGILGTFIMVAGGNAEIMVGVILIAAGGWILWRGRDKKSVSIS